MESANLLRSNARDHLRSSLQNTESSFLSSPKWCRGWQCMNFTLAQCAKTPSGCFITAALIPIRPPNSSTAKRGVPRYRYNSRRPRIRAVESSPNQEPDTTPSPFSSDDSVSDDVKNTVDGVALRAAASTTGTACFLACVECGAVYALDAEELDSEPRPVQCALCRHEWLASDQDLLWGADHARVAAAPRAKAAAAAARRAYKTSSSNRSWSSAMLTESEGLAPALADGGGDALLDDEDTECEDGDDDGFHIFVGNLSFRANVQDLTRAFGAYGKVKFAHIPTDGLGASRGYGFIEMARKADGLRAMNALHGVSIIGRDIALSERRPRPFSEQSGNRHGTAGYSGAGSFREKSRGSTKFRDSPQSQRSKYIPRRNQGQNNSNNVRNDRDMRFRSSDDGMAGL